MALSKVGLKTVNGSHYHCVTKHVLGMSWILSYIDSFDSKFVIEYDLSAMSSCSKSVQAAVGRKLKLDQLLEDELIGIFRWLKPRTLIRIERVSKLFFRIVAKTFHELKHITPADEDSPQDRYEKDRSTFNAVSFVKRFGPSLRSLPFELVLPETESGVYPMQCDASYLKQLAWRFPNLSDVGPLSEANLSGFLVFLKATDKNNIRELSIHFGLEGHHLRDVTGTVMRFRIKLNIIISLCSRLDKLILGLHEYTSVTDAMRVNYDKFLAEFGLLSLELCSKVNRLGFSDRAANSIKPHLPRNRFLNLQELTLALMGSIYYTDKEVQDLCQFAPNVNTIDFRAEVSALKHLTMLVNLETIFFADVHPGMSQSPISSEVAQEAMKIFLKNFGKGLDRIHFTLFNPKHAVPITSWLSEYCPNVSKLHLGIKYEHKLSELKLPKLVKLDYHSYRNISENELAVFFQNNRSLKFATFYCDNRNEFRRLKRYLKQTAASRQLTNRSLVVELMSDYDETQMF
ncbi:hypothetical protein HDE_09362 [Halotydeus destructor]|nr:hypothetical protein HDE_09362 [Halotydeus destructor]